jgi:hypothetical protein
VPSRIPAFDGCVAVCGDRAGVGPGYTLEATAVRLVLGIGELRENGGLPARVRTVTAVDPQRGVLEIQVEGALVVDDDADADLARLLRVAGELFDLASRYNVVPVDPRVPPLFEQRVVLMGSDGRPALTLVGAAAGPLPQTTMVSIHPV